MEGRLTMRIMLIDHYAGSESMGMEFRPYYMAREWAKLGHETTIVAADYTHLRKTNPTVAADFEEQVIDGIRYVFVKTPEYHGNNAGRGRNILSFVMKLRHGAKELARRYRPDAVIASSTYPLDIYPAAKIARFSHAGLFFEIHDLWPLTPMQMGNLPWWNPVILALQAGENYAYKSADRIISILPDTDKYIRLRGYDAGKFVYVPNGVIPPAEDEPEDSGGAPQIEALKSLREQGWFLIGYTGNHSAINALEYFMDASEYLKDEKVKMVLVGNGNHRQALMDRAREKKLTNVLFLDPVPKRSMNRLLGQLDAAYMGLSKSNLFQYGISPNKLFDYMLAAKPVIYAVEASNDPVRDSGCGLSVPVGDSARIAEAVRTLVAMSPAVRDEMGARGRAYVLKNHNYPLLARRFAEALEAGCREARPAGKENAP